MRGGDEDRPGQAPAGRKSQLHPASAVVASVSLDYDGEDWWALKAIYERWQDTSVIQDLAGSEAPPTLDGLLELTAASAGLGYA